MQSAQNSLKEVVESDIFPTVSVWHITILPWPTPAERLSRPPSMTKCASDRTTPIAIGHIWLTTTNGCWSLGTFRFAEIDIWRLLHAKKSF